MNKNKLQIEQLESKIKGFALLTKVATPPTGWKKRYARVKTQLAKFSEPGKSDFLQITNFLLANSR